MFYKCLVDQSGVTTENPKILSNVEVQEKTGNLFITCVD